MPGRFNAWTFAFSLAAAVLIGFVASTLAYRYRILRLPGEPVVARMDRELHLTPAQHSQIRDIMRDTRLRIMQDERDFRRQRRQAFLEALQQIRATLTPEQQQIFDREFLPYGSRSQIQEKREGQPAPLPP
ncbi:MAG TPA: hypothetical protein VMH37_10705 [Candidatus Binataceae bacterium]|nr:hypothetical protein [Candidatus Binataceae bacterium]